MISVSADTAVYSTETLTLTAGKWRVFFWGQLELGWVSASGARVAGAFLRNQSDSTIIARQIAKASLASSNDDLVLPVQLEEIVNISTSKTFDVGVICSHANTVVTARIYGNGTVYSGSNVVGHAKMIATRIG